MALVMGQLYVALRQSGVSEPLARAAAEEAVPDRFKSDNFRRDFVIVKAMAAVCLALTLVMVVKVFA